MNIVYSDEHRRHHPPALGFQWGQMPNFESPGRIDQILTALEQTQIGSAIPPRDFGLEPILAVHDRGYVEFLQTIYGRWVEAGFPPNGAIPDTIAARRNVTKPSGPVGQTGYYISDITAPVVAGTYEAAIASAQVALTAAALVKEGAPVSYALCRPPGHHAHYDMTGGFCYLNNAAIAARSLGGTGRVAILDVDYHAGNGTQSIFYGTDEVFFASIHADPNIEYPYFLGYAEQRGEGQGIGFTLNLPLPFGTGDSDYLAALDKALAAIREAQVASLVVSVGFDTFENDPIGQFKLTTPVYSEIARRISALKLPMVIVQEGGYAIEALGENVVSFLRGIESA